MIDQVIKLEKLKVIRPLFHTPTLVTTNTIISMATGPLVSTAKPQAMAEYTVNRIIFLRKVLPDSNSSLMDILNSQYKLRKMK